MYSYDAQTDSVDIISYIGKEEKVVVPAYIDGKKVRKLCFVFCTWENDKTKEVVISDGIQIIEGFSRCKNLKSVSIPDSVVEITGSAFYDC